MDGKNLLHRYFYFRQRKMRLFLSGRYKNLRRNCSEKGGLHVNICICLEVNMKYFGSDDETMQAYVERILSFLE